jgi:hypothetical protein
MSCFRRIVEVRSLSISVALALGALLAIGSSARADSSPWITSVGGSSTNTASDTLGYEVTLGSTPLQLTALGIWDSNSDGLAASHDVGVWNADGTVLKGFVSIPAGVGATLVNGYRYADLATPMDLAPHTTYIIGASYQTDDEYRWFAGFGDYANDHTAGGITIGLGRYDASTSLTYPTHTTGITYTGPNALFTVVPEPTSLLLLLPATFPAFLRRRRSV